MMTITDLDAYEDMYDELGLEGASVDDVYDDIELSVAFDFEVGADIAVWQCPFIPMSDCEYVITDYVADEGDVDLVKNASAAHLVGEHGVF